jgi:hypothetical protein
LLTAVLGSNPAISPAYSGLPVLKWAAMGWHFAVGCPLRGSRGEYIINTKKQLRKHKCAAFRKMCKGCTIMPTHREIN